MDPRMGTVIGKRSRRTQVFNSFACNHLSPGAAVRRAKVLEQHSTFDASTIPVGVRWSLLLFVVWTPMRRPVINFPANTYSSTETETKWGTSN